LALREGRRIGGQAFPSGRGAETCSAPRSPPPVPGHLHPPSLRHAPLHPCQFPGLHAPCGHPAQRHRLLIRRPQSLSRGLWSPRRPSLSPTTLLCLQESGLSKWLGDKLTPLESVPPAAIAFIICLLIAVFTECTSNVATTTLFLPILASMVSLDRETHLLQGALLPIPARVRATVCPLPPLTSEKGPPSLHPSPGSSVTLGPKAFWPLTHSIPGDVTSGVSCRGSLVAPPHIPGPVPVLVVPEVTA